MVIPLKDDNPTRGTPILTLALIAANVFVFFLVQPTLSLTPPETAFEAQQAAVEEQRFFYRYAAVPCEITTVEPLDVAQLQLDRCDVTTDTPAPEVFPEKNVFLSVLFSMFFHGGLLHLGGNMLFLWIFGNNVEDHLGLVGYALFYLFGGVVATLAHVATQPGSLVPVVGASGAIAAVMGAYLVWWPHARIMSIIPIFFIIQFIRLPAVAILGIWFVMQFFDAFNPNSGVAVAAHIGGFLVGAALAWLLPKPPRRAPAYGWD